MAADLATLDRPIAMMSDYIASQPTTLWFKNHETGGSTVTDVTLDTADLSKEHKQIFKVDSMKPGLSASKRIYNDAAGTAIFEVRRHWISQGSFIGPPKDKSHPLAMIAPRFSTLKDKFDVMFTPAAAEMKPNLNEQLVMQARFVSLATGYVPFTSNEWDIYVAKGMDISLASAIVGYLAASMYDSPYFMSSTKEEEGGSIGSRFGPGVTMGAVVGVGAGAGAGGGGGG